MRTRFFCLGVFLFTLNIILTQNSILADAGEWASDNKIPNSSNLTQNKYYPVTGASDENQSDFISQIGYIPTFSVYYELSQAKLML